VRKLLKPVRKCAKCPLNQGAYCWGFAYPRDQWRSGRCPAFVNPEAHGLFSKWESDPPVKTRKQILQERFPGWKRVPCTGNLEGKKGSEWRRMVKAGFGRVRAVVRDDV